MLEKWETRGNDEQSYQARLFSHEAKTSIEYGEKTWTTEQTVRDLMQNHLDAETEKYYQSLVSIVLDENKVAEMLKIDKEGKSGFKKQLDDFLYAIYMFVSHVGDMSSESRDISEKYLKQLAKVFPLKNSVVLNGEFQPLLFLEQATLIHHELPKVSYNIIDIQTNQSLGWINYETLRDENKYQEKINDEFRYKIDSVKIVDKGSGYDSQLSAFYLSSKTGKRHLRGKFGEGAKMSELHLLRHGGQMKMRSQYQFETDTAEQVNRIWQTRPQIKDGELISKGIEIEKREPGETGSMVMVSFDKADPEFQKEIIKNIDCRLGGLGKNIAEFSGEKFIYPMPITEKSLAGVNMSASSKDQYVQGIKVDLATDSFGYETPWFSYNILDSQIISGRDRNEITGRITNKIETFWWNNDNPALLRQLVHIAIYGQKYDQELSYSSELHFINDILENINPNQKNRAYSEKIQKIIDQAFINELGLEKDVPTFIISHDQYQDCRKQVEYAEREFEGRVVVTAASFSYQINCLAERIKKENYNLITLSDINSMMEADQDREEEEFFEGEHEKTIREVFKDAVESLNSILLVAGITPKKFNLRFSGDWEIDAGWNFEIDESEKSPIKIKSNEVIINSNWVNDYQYFDEDKLKLQRKIEIYLLGAYHDYLLSNYDKSNDLDINDYAFDQFDQEEDYLLTTETIEYAYENTEDEESALKQSQKFLNNLIAKLIPKDSPLLLSIPENFNYEQDQDVLFRLLKNLLDNNETKREEYRDEYENYLKILNLKLNLTEAKELLDLAKQKNQFKIKNILTKRVFAEKGVLNYYNEKLGVFQKTNLGEDNYISEWHGYKVYQLDNGDFFIDVPMNDGAVMSEGEGKNREYYLNEGDHFLHIGKNDVKFYPYGNFILGDDVRIHPCGLIIKKADKEFSTLTNKHEYVQQKLQKYNYYPISSIELGKNDIIKEGVVTTAIPIEYGKDEWDNPIRIFQDIAQNHIDASVGKGGVKLTFEVGRQGERKWVAEEDINESDKIVGLKITDNGDGYSPANIATMGASSKKSPLFAGKYGEGQKMVAAAALRSGINLEYQSIIGKGKDKQSWTAKAVSQNRKVILAGKEVEKQFTAFDVKNASLSFNEGSATIINLSQKPFVSEKEQWEQWVSIIDPRQKDKSGNSGLSRFCRQLRQDSSINEFKVGNISILLDEPGAVYENGLRINPNAEANRSLAFGYDVPEVVTTRERNSYDSERLTHYIRHIFSNITDVETVKKILQKFMTKQKKTLDLKIGNTINYNSARHIWSEAVNKIWPGFFVYSSEIIREDLNGGFMGFLGTTDNSDLVSKIRDAEQAEIIKANMVHLPQNKILDVAKDEYYGFSQIMPTVEDVVNNMKTTLLPITPEIRKILSNIVSQSTKELAKILTGSNFSEKIKRWSDARQVESDPNGVNLAPINSAFHGKVDKGVVFNEILLLEKDKRKLAEVSLHEMVHIISGYKDYTEDFVGLLYNLAKNFAKNK